MGAWIVSRTGRRALAGHLPRAFAVLLAVLLVTWSPCVHAQGGALPQLSGGREQTANPSAREQIRDRIRLAISHYQTGRCIDALPVAKAVADDIRTAFGALHPDLVAALNIAALCHKALAQYEEAEAGYREVIELAETIFGADTFEVAVPLDNLGNLYLEQHLYAKAEPLKRRALDIFVAVKGPESISTLTALQNLGAVYYGQGRHPEAEQHYRQALAIANKVMRPDDPQMGRMLDNLAGAVRSQGRLADAAPLYERAIAIFQTALGPDHPDTILALQNHAILLGDVGEFAASEAQLLRAIAGNERNFGANHPVLVVALNTLANVQIDQKRWSDAVVTLRRAALIMNARRTTTPRAKPGNRREQYTVTYRKLAQALLYAYPGDPAAMDEAFQAAQRALSSDAATALSQMAARFSAADPAIGAVLRERQDLIHEAETIDQKLLAATARPGAQRDRAADEQLRTRGGEVGKRLSEIDAILARDFPGYAALADPQPLGIDKTRGLLRPGESLVLTLTVPAIGKSPDESYVFAATREAARWATIAMDGATLVRTVQALRCGLDATRWQEHACARMLGTGPIEGVMPFDLERAYKLHQVLLGGIADLVTNHHLMFVLDGPLTVLPPHVLVVSQPAPFALDPAGQYRAAAWLGRQKAITVLPSVVSLDALRSVARPSRAAQPFVGFGNPLLTGAAGSDRSAWAKQTCEAVASTGLVSQVRRSAPTLVAGMVFKGAAANLEAVRRQTPLPETADELCAVAAKLGSPTATVKLGAWATERSIKEMSRSGDLARHAIVHFATHGVVAGDLPALAEPALLLTPPDRASGEDDGLLTASEVAQLKLDADWVIMSACNTAAGGADNADALSGLARAFFYAGARALLVSHWAVSSDATVGLVTRAVEALKADPTIGRAEALRRSMIAELDKGPADETHPTYWAPFIVVGEGAGTAPLPVGAPVPPKSKPATKMVTGTLKPAEKKKREAAKSSPPIQPAAANTLTPAVQPQAPARAITPRQ